MGLFYLEIPENCKGLIQPTEKYARDIFQENQELLEGILLNYGASYNKSHDEQFEALRIIKEGWMILDDNVVELAKQMHVLAVDLLKKTFSACQVPEEMHAKMSGRVTDGRGLVQFAFNHYRPKQGGMGLEAHVDTGLVTFLYVDQDQGGLEAQINDQWIKVPPLKDHFVINFAHGAALSINDSNLLTALIHRVARVTNDRFSWAMSVGHRPTEPVYQKKGEEFQDSGKTYGSFMNRE